MLNSEIVTAWGAAATSLLAIPILLFEPAAATTFVKSLGSLLLAFGLVAVYHAISLRRWRGMETIRIRLAGDQILINLLGEEDTFPAVLLTSGSRLTLNGRRFGQWEEYGEPGHSIRIDRRYLRPLHESEDLMPQTEEARAQEGETETEQHQQL
jgi:hypothetical protein